ncbi:hypothetical protein K466DRAFT_588004 [Polyporus arcularius HHB13444]|uniref:Mid2 domain-containing protein n=1 Tax=Polyporus arcularius HHB13444 TaxID=1314778 RepID=A0A5C3PBH4_9APHY|nr:hypothetical protein K466DRAFT_588004 [Polyporus arcularius HHB13444]
MLGYSKSATVAFLLTFLLFLGPANGAPALPEKRTISALRVARDGENLSQSTTVQVTTTLQTAMGPMLQTCTITLDPITGDNGEPLVRETKSCTVTVTSGNNSSGSSTSSSDSSTSTSSADSGSSTSSADSSSSTDSASASSTDSSASSTTDSSAASSTDSAASSATATDASASATATSAGAISDNGTTLVAGSALSSADTAAATATGSASGSGSAPASATATGASASATGGSGAVKAGGFMSVDASVIATESVASGTPTATAAADAANQSGSSATSAADTATSSAAKFQLPGTTLSVLPIGLGVFAGISVIALIVVGLVTYERTKYRRAFRQRKLAESGAAMGYGGMAQAA